MFNILNYPSIIKFINDNLSSHLAINWNLEWITTFCPFCNDLIRKRHPSHGHLNFHKTTPFVHCFRCSYSKSLSVFLKELEFNDNVVIDELSKFNNYDITYQNRKPLNGSTFIDNSKYILEINNQYDIFRKNNFNDFIKFINYVDSRLLNCSLLKFFIRPNYHIVNNCNILACELLNYDMQLVSARVIPPYDNNVRYIKFPGSNMYYFQSLYTLSTKNNIIICEGAFDLINLFNANIFSDDDFYIAMNGSYYRQNLQNIVSNFLMIGEYTINIIIDNGIHNEQNMIRSCHYLINNLNPNIALNFYKSTVGKDISDYMQIKLI